MNTDREKINREKIESIVLKILKEETAPFRIIAGVSNRHVHLSREHADVLFGKGYIPEKSRELRQPGQYACKETVNIVTHEGVLERVRLLGPIRKNTQVELSMSDARRLGVSLPVMRSGNETKTSSIFLIGPKGDVELTSGVGIAWRHIHLSPSEASAMNLRNGDEVDVEVEGDRGVIFRKVWVRVGSDMLSEFHVDIDEANACGLRTGDLVKILWKRF